MSFVSYAQNYEDVILWRTLKHIKNGFYIDVGAMDPTVHSVTKAFYDKGWRGINIEPTPQWFIKLINERPEDTNLQIVVGDKDDKVDFFIVSDSGLSTLDRELAFHSAQENKLQVEHTQVPMRTLNSICEENKVQEIHFLKVDAEGAELRVLQGLDLGKWRPWIILVEATEPGSQLESFADWEPLLLQSEYAFTYFDGLNRFYLAKEHANLASQLCIPPNLFDDFIVWKKLQPSEEIVSLRSQLESAQYSRDKLWQELDSIYQSKSYRFTKPLRKVAKGYRKIRDDIQKTSKTSKGSAFSIFHLLRGLPIITTVADNLKRKFPNVWAKSRNKLMGIHRITQEKTIMLATDQYKDDELYFKNLFQEEIAKRKQQG